MITSFHHVGCLVADMNSAIEDYKILHPGGEVSEIYNIEDQKVQVCFYTIHGVNVEFVAPLDETSSLNKLLQKKGSFYHIGVYTDNIEAEIERLEHNGYRKVNLFRSEAFGGRYCAFLLNNEMHLIELIEQ